MSLNYWEYPVKLIRVIDGDSVWLELDLGLRTYVKANCRLHGINAPEPRGDTYEEGKASGEYLKSLIEGYDLKVWSNDLDKYGRPIVTLFRNEERFWSDVNYMMIQDGYAERYE